MFKGEHYRNEYPTNMHCFSVNFHTPRDCPRSKLVHFDLHLLLKVTDDDNLILHVFRKYNRAYTIHVGGIKLRFSNSVCTFSVVTQDQNALVLR